MQLEVLKITYNWITIPIFLSFLVMSNDTVLHPKEKVELLMNKLIKTAMAIFRIISFGLSCTSLKRFSIAHRSPLTCLRVFTACSKTTSLKQEQLPTAREGNPSGLWHGSSSPGVTRLSPELPHVQMCPAEKGQAQMRGLRNLPALPRIFRVKHKCAISLATRLICGTQIVIFSIQLSHKTRKCNWKGKIYLSTHHSKKLDAIKHTLITYNYAIMATIYLSCSNQGKFSFFSASDA